MMKKIFWILMIIIVAIGGFFLGLFIFGGFFSFLYDPMIDYGESLQIYGLLAIFTGIVFSLYLTWKFENWLKEMGIKYELLEQGSA
jgi:hypothetical protein